MNVAGAVNGGDAEFRWSKQVFDTLVDAARDQTRVSGLTHTFYRYPARFSPTFVRAAIETFTKPGDLVLDPFMGGGTTLVEALALGRDSVGVDISSLAAFVANVKTMVLSEGELSALTRWLEKAKASINTRNESRACDHYAASGYYRHLTSPTTWRLRKSFEQALETATDLRSRRLEDFARCVILRTAQWALDGRKTRPSIAAFREALGDFGSKMILSARELREAVKVRGTKGATTICLNRSAVGLAQEPIMGQRAPRLVLTSPPYPGVHVLYHRWQIDGGKESPAPFWLANKLDGSGAAYYTLGDRKTAQNRTYFEGLQEALTSVASVCDKNTVIVQVVAFSDPRKQLPRYLEVNAAAGLEELPAPQLKGRRRDGRLWRTIPNRKWHADQLGRIPASQEVVLFHRLTR